MNEDETTDTTSGLDGEDIMARSQATQKRGEQAKADSGKDKVVQEGIKSSDEEEPVEEKKEEVAETKQSFLSAGFKKQQADAPSVDLNQSITSLKNQRDIYTDENDRESIEHKYGFSGQNIEEYSAVLENKLDSLGQFDDQPRSTPDSSADFETDYIGSAGLEDDLKDLDAKVGDL